MGSHTVQLPTDNIRRRPSHIYIAPKVPAQPHARPTTGLSYEIRKRAQQTWIGPTGAVALHTTGETRNRGALTYGFHKATTLKARVVTPKDGPSSSQRLRIRNKIVRKWLHNSGRSIDRVDTDFVDAASLKECDRFFEALCDSGRTTVSFEALRDSLAHCCGLEVDGEKLEHVVGSLNSKTRDLLLRERKEFLAAYRAHSFRIQDELQELRAKVQAEQSSTRKDEKVRRLKEDCDWFRREALRLDEEGTKMTQELHKLKTQLDDSERDRSWLLNELSRTQTTTELLAVKIADAEAQRNAPPTPEPEDDGDDDDSAPVVVLSPRERLRREREEKAEIAKRRKQKVQVAHQVADRIKECERYERQIAEERDRVRPPTEESRLLQTEFLEAVLAEVSSSFQRRRDLYEPVGTEKRITHPKPA